MTQDDSFANLFARLQAAEDDVAQRVYARFANRLIALARTRLDQQLRQKVDPEDVMQSVFRSFFGHLREGDYDVKSWDGLWSLLVVITLRKCGREVEFFRSQRRDVRTEVSSDAVSEGVSRLPTPEEVAMLTELVERLFRCLPEGERPILVLRLQGYAVSEIAEQVNRSQRSVERVLQHIRKHTQTLQDP
jgi:RNA polymerase sigma-70 factor (ECF subfamily)